MDIYPQDLGQKNCNRIQKWRRLPGGLVEGTGLDIQDSKAIDFGYIYGLCLGMVGYLIGAITNVVIQFNSLSGEGLLDVHNISLAAGVGGALGCIFGFIISRHMLKKQKSRKVMTREIQGLSTGETDILKQDYLGLASFLISSRAVYDTSEEESIRSAIHSLGAAVETLPAQPTESILINPETLITQAARLTAEAAQEKDAVIASSLGRQALTLTQSAETISRSANLLRRNSVLRNEIAAQIKAMQTSLSASEMGDDYGNHELGNLATRIQQVATEASTLANARVELEAALHTPLLRG